MDADAGTAKAAIPSAARDAIFKLINGPPPSSPKTVRPAAGSAHFPIRQSAPDKRRRHINALSYVEDVADPPGGHFDRAERLSRLARTRSLRAFSLMKPAASRWS